MSDRIVRATAVCTKCGTQSFHIKIYSGTECATHCTKCNQIWDGWPTEAGGQAQDTGGDKAMAEAGDVGAHLVSKAIVDEGFAKIRVEMNDAMVGRFNPGEK